MTTRHRKRNLVEDIVANSSSEEGESERTEVEMVNTSGNVSNPWVNFGLCFCFYFEYLDDGRMIWFSTNSILCHPSLWLEMAERARRRLRSSTASGGQSLSLVARHPKIGESVDAPVVIGGDSFNPIAWSSHPKAFKMFALSRLHAESAKKFPTNSRFAVDNINISLPPNFLGDGDAFVVCPCRSPDDAVDISTLMATSSDAAELSMRVSFSLFIFS